MQAELTYSPMYAKGYDAKTRSVLATLSSDTIDGHGEIVDQATWRLERYRQNPVVLHMHDRYSVVGRAEDLVIVDGLLVGRIVFATTRLADEVATLFRDGAMRAFSVGFRPGRTASEIVSGRTVRRLLDCELFEVSAVSIPSNPDAVVRHKSLGLVPANFELNASEALVHQAFRMMDGEPPAPTGDAARDFLAAAEHFGKRLDESEPDPFDFGGAA